MHRVLRHIRRAAYRGTAQGPTDAHLLECFLTRHDEAAFEALLRRHGPMVLGVCRRVLHHAEDAEDAFQATFLILVRKAGSLRSRELLGNWLYGVAHRTALKARAMSAKRRAKERQASQAPRPETPENGTSEDLLARLDAALGRLPEKYRVPIVLCELEGRSRTEVAGRLHIPEGTLSSRLAYAKKLLARRLAPYTTGALALELARETASARVSARLLRETARAALHVVAGESLTAGTVSAQVVTLVDGVLKAMLWSKIKGFVAVAFVLLAGVGVVGLTHGPAVAQPVPGPAPAPPSEKLRPAPQVGRAAPDELEELRLEIAALRKGLELTRERVKTLEGEVQTLQRKHASAPLPKAATAEDATLPASALQRLLMEQQYAEFVKGQQLAASDPLADAEAALKKLRQQPNDKQAAEALERAVRWLKEREKPQAPLPKGH